MSARLCARCGKLQVEQYRPFCSKRCADLDLQKWLTGAYVIPGQPSQDDDSDGVQGSGDPA